MLKQIRKGLRLVLLPMLLITATSCALFSTDPYVREPGRIVRDGFLDGRVLRAIRAGNERLAQAHLRVAAQDGLVLLLGQVANDTDRELAAQQAAAVDGVTRVHNELELGGATSLLARTNDRWLATKVRARLLVQESTRVPSLRVVAENGTVFLLGRVERNSVSDAVSSARSVFGVERVVTLFDYASAATGDVAGSAAVTSRP